MRGDECAPPLQVFEGARLITPAFQGEFTSVLAVPRAREVEVRLVLDEIGWATEAARDVFGHVPGLHFARLVLIPPKEQDSALYLALETNFDGEMEPHLHSLVSGPATATERHTLAMKTCLGVPAGTAAATQPCTSKPLKPDSATVGTSGVSARRVAPVTARILSFPALTKGRVPATESHSTCTRPLTTSGCAACAL